MIRLSTSCSGRTESACRCWVKLATTRRNLLLRDFVYFHTCLPDGGRSRSVHLQKRISYANRALIMRVARDKPSLSSLRGLLNRRKYMNWSVSENPPAFRKILSNCRQPELTYIPVLNIGWFRAWLKRQTHPLAQRTALALQRIQVVDSAETCGIS